MAHFRTREDAERCAAELSDDYLHQVEEVERPWVLRMARPAATYEEAGDHELELEQWMRRPGSDLDSETSPLDPHREPEFRFSSEEDED